jgi:hypothetical protein
LVNYQSLLPESFSVTSRLTFSMTSNNMLSLNHYSLLPEIFSVQMPVDTKERKTGTTAGSW